MFGLHCSGTYLSPDLGEFTYCDQGWVWGKFGEWCSWGFIGAGVPFKHGKDVFLLVGWLVVESLATAGLNTILGTLRPRNSTRSCGSFFCVSLVFAGGGWHLQELSESVATIEAWLAVKTPRQSHVVDLCCGKQGRSGRPCGELVGVRRSIKLILNLRNYLLWYFMILVNSFSKWIQVSLAEHCWNVFVLNWFLSRTFEMLGLCWPSTVVHFSTRDGTQLIIADSLVNLARLDGISR